MLPGPIRVIASKKTCSPARTLKSTVFQTSVLLTRTRCGPGWRSQVIESPQRSVATRRPSTHTICCRDLKSYSDVRVMVTVAGRTSSNRAKP
jgi:hypothetical protein